MQENYSESIKKEVDRAKHILICAHMRPDPDAIGSSIALGTMLQAVGKDVSFFVHDFSNLRYQDFPEVDAIQDHFPKRKVDLVFGLDYGKMDRLSIDKLIARDKPVLITIDHHPFQDQQGKVVWIDAKKSSTAEMVYELADALKFPISEVSALYLMLGIVGDTVGLITPGVTPRLFEILARLMERGGSFYKVQTRMRSWDSFERMKLVAKAMLRAKLYPKEQLAVSWVPRKDCQGTGVDPDEVAITVAHELREIKDYPIALTFSERSHKWYAHFRSRGDSKIDLGKIAKEFGGGGHRNASAFTSTLARPVIVQKVRKMLQKESA